MRMKASDVNRRCRIFDRPDDPYSKGLPGRITDVYDEFNFRFEMDNGKQYELSIKTVQVQFLDGEC